mmetsp:Transcript_5543/g.18379  ORF Transcript_5543/g.18379 Transcript_5543/m.18379 type:complete len:223 (+) Transcript_5543:1589-2257(+)|eukprot:scaffold17782_cov113-Isochrysis_galbana.AAC.3
MCHRTRFAEPRRPLARSHDGDSVTSGSTQAAIRTGRFVAKTSNRHGLSRSCQKNSPDPIQSEPRSVASVESGESTSHASSTVRSEPTDQNHETALRARPREPEGDSSANSSNGLHEPPNPMPTSNCKRTSAPKLGAAVEPMPAAHMMYMARSVAPRRPCVSASSPKKGVDAQDAANDADASRVASSGEMPNAWPAHGGKKARRFVCKDCATTNRPMAGIVNQ